MADDYDDDDDVADWSPRQTIVVWTKEQCAAETAARAVLDVIQGRQEYRRRAERLKKQRCTCCTNAEIKEFYLKAHAQGLQVDHIVPLFAGGPHCLKNFQAMTKERHYHKTGPLSAYRKADIKRDRNKR